MAQCPTCHLGYFTPCLIALSPSLPVLRYIHDYLNSTPNRMPLHEVFAQLQLAMAGHDVPALPDPRPILPFLQLFTIVILKPGSLVGRCLLTLHLPALSILQDDHFVLAPDGTLPGDENVARIFDVLEMIGLDHVPESFGVIPLSSEHPEFTQQRYWRLTLPTEAILAALIARVATGTFESKEILVAQAIYHKLRLEIVEAELHGRGGPSVGGGPGHGGGRGGGHGRARARGGGRGGKSGRGRGGSGRGARGGGGSGLTSTHKMKLRSTNCEPPCKKGRRMGEGGLNEKSGLRSRPLEIAESGLSDTNSSQERYRRLRLDDWEVASSFSTTIGNESVRTKSPFEDSESMFKSEDGCDDPAAWRFGPKYGSDMIIVAARGISLV